MLALNEIASLIGARVEGDGDVVVNRVSTLQGGGPGSLSFLSNRRYREYLGATESSAVILGEEFVSQCPVPALVHSNPYLAFARAAQVFHPDPPVQPGIDDSARVHPAAEIHPGAQLAALCVVEAGARIGPGVFIGPGTVVGAGARIGEGSCLLAQVTICPGVIIGERVRLHPGVVIGADGFGIANDSGRWVKVPQIGSVVLGDDVEVGANTTVDRGALENTIIERGVKLDNLIQVGHAVRIGEDTAIAACTAIAGSSRIGARCIIGGGCAIAGHLEIADDVHLTATSAVPSSIAEAGVYSSGMPVQDNRSWRRNMVRLRQLDDMARRIKSLEQAIVEMRAELGTGRD